MVSLKTISRQCICCFFLVAFSLHSVNAQISTSPEYELKAVFLYNFTQFVEWPSAAFPSEQSPLIIGVLGDNPFGSYLKDVVAGEKVSGHPLIIQRYDNAEDIKGCHILFITEEETESPANKLGQITTDLKKYNVLTVSDAPNFLSQGGMVRFYTKQNKIQLQINLDAVKEADLVISSKLLRLAEMYTIKK